MFVTEIMSKPVKTVTEDVPISDLSKIFEEVSFRHLLVVDGLKLVGVISDRDVVANLSPFLGTDKERDEDRAHLNITAGDIMAKALITVDDESLIDSASILLIENNISCLPVVNELGEISGIISWKDILQYHVYGVDTTLNS